jgi:hypothetical protein
MVENSRRGFGTSKGRPKGARNKAPRERVEKAAAEGALPHELLLTWAREYRAREVAFREAASTPGIDPTLQIQYIAEADRLSLDGRMFARDAAQFYAAKLNRLSGDKDAPLYNGPPIVHIVNFKEEDCN